jgi:hypothetical protein
MGLIEIAAEHARQLQRGPIEGMTADACAAFIEAYGSKEVVNSKIRNCG